MYSAFLVLGLALLAVSLAVIGLVIARLFPGFEPQEGLRLRWLHFIVYLRSDWRLRTSLRAAVYLGFTGGIWVLAGLILSLLPLEVRA